MDIGYTGIGYLSGPLKHTTTQTLHQSYHTKIFTQNCTAELVY